MRMAFGAAGVGQANKFAAPLELAKIFRAHITQTGSEPSQHLKNNFVNWSLVWRQRFYALGHIFFLSLLSVAVSAFPNRHGAQGPHAAKALKFFASDFYNLTRCFISAGQKRAEHHGVRARGNGFGNVAGIANAAVSDD